MMLPPKKWRTEAQIRGFQGLLQRAIDVAVRDDVQEVTLLNRRTAEGILEILIQARWVEHGHEMPPDMLDRINREIDVDMAARRAVENES